MDANAGGRPHDQSRHRFELVRAELQRIEWSDEVRERFGTVKAVLEKKEQRIEDFDAAIAAHAIQPGAVVVTANMDDMIRIPGLTIENWLSGSPRR
jgi:tRNA(fMet)-specific endonuclease VapC